MFGCYRYSAPGGSPRCLGLIVSESFVQRYYRCDTACCRSEGSVSTPGWLMHLTSIGDSALQHDQIKFTTVLLLFCASTPPVN